MGYLDKTYVLGSTFTIGLVLGGGKFQVFYGNLTTPAISVPMPFICDTLIFKTGNYYYEPATGGGDDSSASSYLEVWNSTP